MTLSRKILSAVALSAPLLGFAAPTATSLDGLFARTSNPDVYESATVMHVTWQGTLNDANDVAWLSFSGQQGQRFWADHDDIGGDSLTDSTLALFDANGRLLAYDDDADADAGSYNDGSNWSTNAFLGAYVLPATGVYYLALTSTGNGADTNAGCGGSTTLQQPGSEGIGGEAYTGCSAGFALMNGGTGVGSFTMHVSLADGTAVPEPGTLPLSALALAGLLARRRRG